ncbi:MAG: DUF222 domain-containing protein [Gemmatimonadales bacterium]|jgi:hypothetical protein
MGCAMRRVREKEAAYDTGFPTLDPDAREELAEEIRALAAHLHAGTARLCALVARFDETESWKPDGHRHCANWLSLETGFSIRVSRDLVRAGRALSELPETTASMRRGALSFCQVRALTRVATPETESDLLALAEHCSTAVLERECRAWKTHGRKDEAERERELHDSRRLALFPDANGMYRIAGDLMPEDAATVGTAIARARFALYREDRKNGRGTLPLSPEESARRNADALGLLAEWALAYRAGPDEDVPVSGTRAERFQVMVHVDLDTLSADREPGRSELADGTRLSAETARRLACDCGVVRVEHDPDGEIVGVGSRTRSLPASLRRALETRDRGCRFPGCGLRFTDGHHIVHWADGGPTRLDNTVLLCRFHHGLLHEGGWTLRRWGKDRHFVFIDPRGQAHAEFRRKASTRVETGGDATANLVLENLAAGILPSAEAPRTRWKHERQIPDRVLFRAREATAPG